MKEKILQFYKDTRAKIEQKWAETKLIDKYILSQMLEIFVLGLVIFTSIIFASETFTQLFKQISDYGISFNVAFVVVILNLPQVFVTSIPISTLFATVMTINKLSLNSEITVFKACGISIPRIAKPVMFFALVATIASLAINELVVPVASAQSKQLGLYSLQQKHVPNGKTNYTLKELKDGKIVKRLFYVQECKDNILHNVTLVDMSKSDTVQIVQTRSGKTSKQGWIFENGIIYTLSKENKTLNTAVFGDSVVNFGLDSAANFVKTRASQFNFFKLARYIKEQSKNPKVPEKEILEYKVALFDKIALPLTTIALALVGIPLAITPPRVRYNRGFLFSVLIIFACFVIRAFSLNLGETKAIPPFFAAALPVIIIGVVGYILYRKKAYHI
ncbi:LptF/LptG family permease [bacterium]|nr:LptF/LptG family permease [bacterium]